MHLSLRPSSFLPSSLLAPALLPNWKTPFDINRHGAG